MAIRLVFVREAARLMGRFTVLKAACIWRWGGEATLKQSSDGEGEHERTAEPQAVAHGADYLIND